MCFVSLIPCSCDDRRLESFELAFSAGLQACPHAERHGQHGTQRVANRRAKNNRHSQCSQNSHTDIAHRWATAAWRFTIRKISEHESPDGIEFSSLLQVH